VSSVLKRIGHRYEHPEPERMSGSKLLTKGELKIIAESLAMELETRADLFVCKKLSRDSLKRSVERIQSVSRKLFRRKPKVVRESIDYAKRCLKEKERRKFQYEAHLQLPRR